MNDELGRRMDAAVDDVRLPSDMAATVLRRVGARRRRRTVAMTATTLAVAGSAALLVTQPADDGPDRLVPARASDGVVRDGTRVVGTGRVVRAADGTVQLCAGPEARALVGYPPGKEPPPAPCPRSIAVDLRGAYDLDLLRDRFEKAGAVEGWATLTGTLTGTYRQRTLVVERQEPPPAPDRGAGWYTRSEPPCDPPPGGWPRDPRLLVPVGDPDEGDVNLTAEQPVLDRYRAAHPSRFVDVSLQRPFPDSAVLGVITPDEPARRAVEAALRPTYGERLCVVVSRYTREQVAEADRALRPYMPEADALGIANASVRVADGLQREMHAEVVAVTPELQAIADRFPPGLVRLEPTLVPVS